MRSSRRWPRAGVWARAFKCIEQLSDPAIGGVEVIGGDIFPNLVEIEVRIDAKNEAAHARDLRRCSDLLCNRALAVVG